MKRKTAQDNKSRECRIASNMRFWLRRSIEGRRWQKLLTASRKLEAKTGRLFQQISTLSVTLDSSEIVELTAQTMGNSVVLAAERWREKHPKVRTYDLDLGEIMAEVSANLSGAV